MLTDPIADYLTRIRNALEAEHDEVQIPASRLKREMSRILKEQGYITDFAVEGGEVGDVLRLTLRYTDDRDPVISGLERVSRPGRRVYASVKNIPQVANGLGVSILSTPKGVMADHEAKAANVGGEVLCRVF